MPNAIDGFTAGGGALPAGFQALFNLPQGQLVNGLEQFDGENATGAQIAGFELMNQFMSLLLVPFTEGHNNGVGPIPFAAIGEQPPQASAERTSCVATEDFFNTIGQAPSSRRGRASEYAVNLGGHNEVVLMQSLDLLGLQRDRHIAPTEADIRMMAFSFREFTNLLNKSKRLPEIAKPEAPLDAVSFLRQLPVWGL